jgi:hypothetical protein
MVNRASFAIRVPHPYLHLRYTCYSHKKNFQPWQYYTGTSDAGMAATVSTFDEQEAREDNICPK